MLKEYAMSVAVAMMYNGCIYPMHYQPFYSLYTQVMPAPQQNTAAYHVAEPQPRMLTPQPEPTRPVSPLRLEANDDTPRPEPRSRKSVPEVAIHARVANGNRDMYVMFREWYQTDEAAGALMRMSTTDA